ncbi:MAG: OPT/YSL family transporter, partial [Verrucomicrobiota bacterium]|nr:OPT/YSL family transporter [Verrucomicrobiota bacterium]
MALAQLTDEQTRTWTREEKDRWWLENVYRGDLPQLTLRSGLTGFLLGGVLSATNLYVGGKAGVTLGVNLTSVILAFVMFRLLARIRLAKDFTILENNAMQSIATAAGYMTVPLISSLAAYMMVTNVIIPWWQMAVWMAVMSLVGVLVAFPLKRRFINEDQLPFPEGRACGVVLDALYHGAEGEGVFKAKLLGITAGLAALYQFLISDGLQRLLQFSALRLDRLRGWTEPWHLHERLDDYYYMLAAQWQLWTPKILGTEFRTLGLRLTIDAAMLGVGGLMGIRVATSVFLGTVINFAVLAPIMVARGDIAPRPGPDGALVALSRAEIVNQWSLWWAVTMMVVGSLIALAGKPELFTSAFKNLRGKKKQAGSGSDVLKEIELPLWISFIGVPVLSVLGCYLTHLFFGVPMWLALLSLPLILLLTVIAVNSMALTSWTPTSSLSKITQFTIGAIDRTNPASNLITGGMTAEVASNAANLLSDIKPGYMLGAKPRQQAIGHVIGIISGAIAATPLFFVLFLPPDAAGLR